MFFFSEFQKKNLNLKEILKMCDHAIIIGKENEDYNEELSYRELMGYVIEQIVFFNGRVNINSKASLKQ